MKFISFVRENSKRVATSVVLALATGLFAAEAAPPRVDNPRTVTVGERSVVDIYVSPFQDTLIVLPAAEKVRQVFVGDTKNWLLQTGKSEEPGRYISIKVVEPVVNQTTVNVLSDHDKSYTFRLILSAAHCDSKVFVDPDSQLADDLAKPPAFVSVAELDRVKREAADAQAAASAATEKAQASADSYRAQYPAKLRFDYKWDRKAGEKLGVAAIFRDDKFTYITGSFEEPPTFYEEKEGKPSLIAFAFADGTYVTPRVVNRGYLALGGNGNGKHQEKVEFHREQEGN